MSMPECNGTGAYVFVINERFNSTSGNWSKWPNLEMEEVEVFGPLGNLLQTFPFSSSLFFKYC